MSKAFIALLGVALTLPSIAGPTFTGSEADDFAMGTRFAQCAAFFDLAAEFMHDAGKPSASENFKNLSRGWSIAGRVLLSSGASSPKLDTEQTINYVRDARLTALKAQVELGGVDVFTEMRAQHEQDCDPLIPLQQAMIQALRMTIPATPKR